MASGGRRRKARWGSRTRKSRKGKYLSLSRIIVKTEEVETPPAQDDARSPSSPRDEEEAELKDENGGNHDAEPPFALLHHEASTLFEPLPAPSLSDILGAASSDGSASPSTSPGGVSAGGAGFPGAEVREEEEAEDLARRALRGRERWVYCRTSSSNSSSPTTTSSSSPCSSSAASTGASARPSLLLKLDYGEILAAWADRGPLYIGHAAPKQDAQPELVDNAVQVLVAVEPAQAQHPPATACAPETVRCVRAESVRRYKEKRRNRLFAHRVRYEVRRVNAVKRPRFKGRFVKEHGEMEIEAT